jgi:hypothetical protein
VVQTIIISHHTTCETLAARVSQGGGLGETLAAAVPALHSPLQLPAVAGGSGEQSPFRGRWYIDIVSSSVPVTGDL